ncbi:MAG: von Willebrand factor type A domain-containing protein, partial [Deltaproteobacteria bacterium]|nr:von Willebrand factor type A domain-containing protein [Deltaproteobacteria bacterium]
MLLWPPPCYISGVKPLAPTLLVPFALALAPSLAACGSAPPRDQPGIVALPGGAHAAFAHYGTNPTVDTAEEALSRVGLGADHASMAIVRHYLGQGVMPPPEAVRVEDIVAASLAPMIVGQPARPSIGIDGQPGSARPSIGIDGQPGSARPSIGIEVALVPSPFRKGWHALVVAVTPAARVPEAPPVVVSSTPHDPLALALMARGARLEVGGIPALRRLLDPASRARLVLIDDAAGLGGVEAQGPLLAEVARWREGGGVLSVVECLGPGTDDALLDRLAQDGGGLHEVVLAEDLADSARLATLAARLSAPIGLRAATAEL